MPVCQYAGMHAYCCDVCCCDDILFKKYNIIYYYYIIIINNSNNRILNVQTPMYVEVPTSFAILFRVVFQTYTNKATRGDETSIISY